MFFLLRAAFCITLVVMALPGQSPTLPGPEAVTAASAAASDLLPGIVETMCSEAPARCVSGATASLKAAIFPGTGAVTARSTHRRPSTDSLTASDLRPNWSGPRAAQRG